MPITYVSGDPLLTQQQILAFGHNAKGRTELGVLETQLLNLYPAPFATYGKQCRNERIKPGDLWLWRETQPMLGFMVIRESAVGATRLRHVEAVLLKMVRDYRLENIESVAFAPIGTREEWPALRPVVDYWLSSAPFPCVVYEQYLPGVAAE
ncbi:MAG: hypothetical protein K8L99_34135 [Anaerolineae bacterium]|nr:hypothetical protein [Anaerolineae bacterium]